MAPLRATVGGCPQRSVRLVFMLLLRAAGAAQVCESHSASDQQLSPVRLPFDGTGVDSSNDPLHLQYTDWKHGMFHRHDASPWVPRFEAQGAGNISFGVSYATARVCHLAGLEFFDPAQHGYEINTETLDSKPVTMEVQLHHVCESQDRLQDRLDNTQARLDTLKSKEHKLIKHLAKHLDEASSANAHGSGSSTAKEEQHQIKTLRDGIHRDEQNVRDIKENMEYEGQYHRKRLAKKTVVSVLLHVSTDGDDADDALIDFLNAVSTRSHVGGSPASLLPRPGEWLSKVSPNSFHYQGTLTRPPCDGPVDWFVLDRPNSISRSAFQRFTKQTFQQGKLDKHEKHEVNSAHVESVQVVSRILNVPKYSLEAKSERRVTFALGIALLLAVALLFHIAGRYPTKSEVFWVFLFIPFVVVAVCSLAGAIRVPSPSLTTAGGYGAYAAWQAIVEAVTAWHFWAGFATSAIHVFAVLMLAQAHPAVIPIACVAELVVCSVAGAISGMSKVWSFYFTWFLNAHVLKLLLAFLAAALSWAAVAYVTWFALMFSLNTPSILVFPVMLMLYWALGKVYFLSYVWSAFEHGLPVAALLVKLNWVGIPVTVCVLMASWLVLPLFAWVTGSVTCSDGMDWEVHVTFAFALIYLSVLWGTLRQGVLRGKGPVSRALIFMFYTLAMLDMYTDAVFICIAHACGWDLAWIALLFYGGGVIVLQLIVPAVGYATQENGGRLGFWSLMLFPAELLGGQQAQENGYTALTPEGVEGLDKCDMSFVKFALMIQAILRFAAEDLPQCILQYLFTVHVKRNPVIILSIAISIASSAFSVGKAVYNALQPLSNVPGKPDFYAPK